MTAKQIVQGVIRVCGKNFTKRDIPTICNRDGILKELEMENKEINKEIDREEFLYPENM